MKPAASVLTIIVLVLFLVFPFSHASAYDIVIGSGTGSQGKETSVTVACDTSHSVQVTFIYTDGSKKVLEMDNNSKPMRYNRLKTISLPGGVQKNVKNGQVWIIID